MSNFIGTGRMGGMPGNNNPEAKGTQMGVRTTWRVDISCDGPSSDCPCGSTFSADLHLSASLQLARRVGWSINDLTLCPECSGGEAVTGHLSRVPAGQALQHPYQAA